ncbi:PQQ-binding-like beta-propeller repeat protein [Ruania zhangjianzhongii]|uniref:outer membrane protein assembly factor BamB family protein n=1 Tax=Ruania zhangjianzhongii TaxID=2603206 RepID=UPI001C9E7524|nr:PQQ-binding-like beta-propeller repeat protein [Ruania zhangjianzhongii]
MGGACLIVLAIVLSGIFTDGGSDEADPPTAPTATEDPTPDLAEDWLLTPAEAAGADDVLEFNTSPDGAFTGPRVIAGEDRWAMLTEAGESTPEQIVGIDPGMGEVTWRHDAPGGLCGDEIVDGVLACLINDGGWSGLVVDVATGEAQQWHAPDVDSALVVHLTSEGLLVVGDLAPRAPHTMVTLLAVDGDVRWQVDLADIPAAKTLFTDFLQTDVDGQSEGEAIMERPRWRDLDDGRVLLWSSPGAALIDPASGEISASECRRATAAGDHYFCATDEGVVRHELDGSVEWTMPDLDLLSPPDTTPARPLAVADQTQLVGADWTDGTEGQVQYRFSLTSGGFVNGAIPLRSGGTPEHTVVWAENAMVGLSPEADEVLWTMDLADAPHLSEVFAVDGTLVTDSHPVLGLDPATGEQLWTGRTEHGFAVEVVGDRLVSVGYDAIAPLALPE